MKSKSSPASGIFQSVTKKPYFWASQCLYLSEDCLWGSRRLSFKLLSPCLLLSLSSTHFSHTFLTSQDFVSFHFCFSCFTWLPFIQFSVVPQTLHSSSSHHLSVDWWVTWVCSWSLCRFSCFYSFCLLPGWLFLTFQGLMPQLGSHIRNSSSAGICGSWAIVDGFEGGVVAPRCGFWGLELAGCQIQATGFIS